MRGMVVAALLGAGCSSILGIEDLTSSSTPDDAEPPPSDTSGPPQCRAQRVVGIAAGTGSLSWFTQVWPIPFVINNFNPTFAYDDPTRAASLSTSTSHPLFARRLGVSGVVWQMPGRQPQPSIFVAGQNETHTNTPSSVVSPPGSHGLFAAGAAIQASLDPAVRVLVIGNAGPYGTAPLAPSIVATSDRTAAIQIVASESGATAAELTPSAAQLAMYVPNAAQAPANVVNMASNLAFAANAFRANALGTLIIQGFNDDPHGAFSDPNLATTRTDQLATLLDAFYRDLATSNERDCGDDGEPLSLADNTVLVVYGDTTKNPFDRAGWSDASPGNSTVLYVRGNGFTKPGWFGALEPMLRINFDPVTGERSPGATNAASTAAAWGGTLYAIARGDLTTVQQYTNQPFQGTIVAGP